MTTYRAICAGCGQPTHAVGQWAIHSVVTPQPDSVRAKGPFLSTMRLETVPVCGWACQELLRAQGR